MTFRLSDQRCEEIKDIVVSTFEKLDIRCIPISGFEIATKLGAMIIPYSSKSIEEQKLMLKESEDGFSIKYNGTWYIFYNDRKGYGRTNNTLTHECGHIVLDRSSIVRGYSSFHFWICITHSETESGFALSSNAHIAFFASATIGTSTTIFREIDAASISI